MSGLRRKGKGIVWNVCVPEELALKVELFLAAGGPKPIYGLRSQIICALLTKWVSEQAVQPTQPIASAPFTTATEKVSA